jgi:hypothetical protein
MVRRLSLTLITVLIFAAGVAAADGKSKSILGSVKSLSSGSFVVDTDKGDMTFAIDAHTKVFAKGASTKTKEKKDAGQGALLISDVVHLGDQVLVRYTEAGATFMASEVEVKQRRPASAQPGK